MVNRLLDTARPWIPPVGVISVVMGLGMVSYGGSAGWLYITFGLILILIRPVGTQARRWYRVRKAQRQLELVRYPDEIREWK